MILYYGHWVSHNIEEYGEILYYFIKSSSEQLFKKIFGE